MPSWWTKERAATLKKEGAVAAGAAAVVVPANALALAAGWTPGARKWWGLGTGLVGLAGGAAVGILANRPNLGMGMFAGGLSAVGAFMGAVDVPAVSTVPLVMPVVYGERGGGISGAMDRALPWSQRARMKCIALHTVADEFVAHGLEHTKRVRQALGDIEVWWQVGADYHYNDVLAGRMTVSTLQALRENVATIGRRAGIAALVNDCEPAWKHNAPGFNESAAREMVKRQFAAGGGGMLIGLTSYPNPAVNQDFPWIGFRDCNLYSWQFYDVPDDPPMPADAFVHDGAAFAAYQSDQRGVDATIRLGQINPNARHVVQLQLHNNHVADIGHVADKFPQTMGWNFDLANADGLRLLLALQRLADAGFSGVGSVSRFQSSVGISPTGRLDAATLARLGA